MAWHGAEPWIPPTVSLDKEESKMAIIKTQRPAIEDLCSDADHLQLTPMERRFVLEGADLYILGTSHGDGLSSNRDRVLVLGTEKPSEPLRGYNPHLNHDHAVLLHKWSEDDYRREGLQNGCRVFVELLSAEWEDNEVVFFVPTGKKRWYAELI